MGISAGLPLTALIDVIFLVVIFFMINAVFSVTSHIPVDLPDEPGDSTSGNRAIVLTIDAAGIIYVDEEQFYVEELIDVLTEKHEREPGVAVFVNAEQSLPYQVLVDVLGAVRDSGIGSLSLLTDPAPAS